MTVAYKSRLNKFGIATLVGLTACAPIYQESARQPVTLIAGVTIIDPSDGSERKDQNILIAGGRITAVGPNSFQLPVGTLLIDGRGKFAIPGLWDMHVHFMNTGPSALPLYIVNGVTSVREMGGYIDSTRAWQARMTAGTMIGPRFKTPGPVLENPRYLANVRVRDSALGGGRLASRILPYRIGVADSVAADRAIDSLKSLHVDFVKFRTVASKSAYFEILAAAKRAGLTVAGHLPGVVDVGEASDAGQKSLEHAFLPVTSTMSDAARKALYARIAKNGTWYTPTLVVSREVMMHADSANRLIWGDDGKRNDPAWPYASEWLLGWWRMQVDERINQPDTAFALLRGVYASSVADVRGLADAGVRILAGTDAGSVLVYPGFSLHDELRLLVEDAKLTPRQALWAATLGPAIYFGMEKDLGKIASGKIADFVLLDADPLANIRNTTRIFGVSKGGRFFDRAELDSLRESVRQR
ncbi:MAG TPA: amidohydrolase family protein [Gemmatimonadaceae bacterium]|nr:amidohydrolase family protein [Gemmatimonadaceae bacterium]